MHIGIRGLALLGFIIGAAGMPMVAHMMAPMSTGLLEKVMYVCTVATFMPYAALLLPVISFSTLAILLPLEPQRRRRCFSSTPLLASLL